MRVFRPRFSLNPLALPGSSAGATPAAPSAVAAWVNSQLLEELLEDFTWWRRCFRCPNLIEDKKCHQDDAHGGSDLHVGVVSRVARELPLPETQQSPNMIHRETPAINNPTLARIHHAPPLFVSK